MLRTPSSLIAGTPTDVAADLSAGAAAHLRAEGVTDLMWALVNTREFILNH